MEMRRFVHGRKRLQVGLLTMGGVLRQFSECVCVCTPHCMLSAEQDLVYWGLSVGGLGMCIAHRQGLA